MEQITLLLEEGRKERIFSEETLRKLAEIGKLNICILSRNQGESQQISLPKETTILVTSWGTPCISKELCDQMPKLRLVLHAAGSVKGIASEEIFRRQVKVGSSAKVLGEGVAETALGLTIASLKNFWQLQNDTRNGLWDEHLGSVRELYQVRIGVLGAGAAGAHYIRLLRNFSVEILLVDPFLNEEQVQNMGARKVFFQELLEESDVISIHAPSIPETHHMFSTDALQSMKKDAILINTARGSLVDEEALYCHMKAGNLKYACLDVTDPEPPSPDNPLRTLPNVIMTPHIAGLANNGIQKIGAHILQQIVEYLETGHLLGEVTEEMLNHMA